MENPIDKTVNGIDMNKKNCALCLKDKSKYKLVSIYTLCVKCINSNDELSKKIVELEQSSRIEVNSPIEYRSQLKEEEVLMREFDSYVEKIIISNKEKEILINQAQSRIMAMNTGNSELQKNIDPSKISKHLSEFDIDSLKNLSNTLNSSKDLDEFKNQRKILQEKEKISLPNPKQLFFEISQEVIKQSHAIKIISNAIANHYCRMMDSSIKKHNIMIMGPTGTGKTEICRSLATKINLPFITVDATSLTQSGYKGSDVIDSIITPLLVKSNYDLKKSQFGIVFIDEIDKKANIHSDESSGVGTKNVQFELLKMIEGGDFVVGIPNEKGIRINKNFSTKNLLFIAAGAFSDMPTVLKNAKKIGVNSEVALDIVTDNTVDSLIKYGLIPEIVGRFSVFTKTEEFELQDYISILLKGKNSLTANYKRIFEQYRIKLIFTSNFLEEVAMEAMRLKIGARGLESVFERKMEDYNFNIYDYVGQELIVDANGKSILKMK